MTTSPTGTTTTTTTPTTTTTAAPTGTAIVATPTTVASLIVAGGVAYVIHLRRTNGGEFDAPLAVSWKRNSDSSFDLCDVHGNLVASYAAGEISEVCVIPVTE